MIRLLTQLHNDEAGFVVSAELILIATIAVVSLIVGLSEASFAVNEELEDVGSAVGSINQGYAYTGAVGHKGYKAGSFYGDFKDDCDSQFNLTCDIWPVPEAGKWNND